MKQFCERHAFREFKRNGNQIQIMGRILPSQQLTKEQQKCSNGSACHNAPKWMIRYISEMNIRVLKKGENPDQEVNDQSE